MIDMNKMDLGSPEVKKYKLPEQESIIDISKEITKR
jgi:hypothetical protein